MNSKTLLGLLAASGILASPALAIVSIDYVPVGNVGNPNDPATGYGSVSYSYQIGKYEVTNSQYSEFLNAAAKSDPYGLYNPKMVPYGISQTGTSGSFSYSVTGALANRPVGYVSWFDAARFANWLLNGQGNGDTETGAYALNGAGSGIFLAIAGAAIHLPTENEWYKAAYYSGSGASYWNYPNRTDFITTADANYANLLGASSDVGSYPNDASFYGTFDQGGNVWEWNDAVIDALRCVRGGAWESYDYLLHVNALHAEWRGTPVPTGEYANVGFRVAAIPEPSAGVLLLGIAAMLLRRARREEKPAALQ